MWDGWVNKGDQEWSQEGQICNKEEWVSFATVNLVCCLLAQWGRRSLHALDLGEDCCVEQEGKKGDWHMEMARERVPLRLNCRYGWRASGAMWSGCTWVVELCIDQVEYTKTKQELQVLQRPARIKRPLSIYLHREVSVRVTIPTGLYYKMDIELLSFLKFSNRKNSLPRRSFEFLWPFPIH